MNHFAREAARAAPCHFVTSCAEVAHALMDIAVNAAECLSARSAYRLTNIFIPRMPLRSTTNRRRHVMAQFASPSLSLRADPVF